jgi:hypothetical protein
VLEKSSVFEVCGRAHFVERPSGDSPTAPHLFRAGNFPVAELRVDRFSVLADLISEFLGREESGEIVVIHGLESVLREIESADSLFTLGVELLASGT